MVPKAARKTTMSDINTDQNTFDRKLNDVITVAQEQPAELLLQQRHMWSTTTKLL